MAGEVLPDPDYQNAEAAVERFVRRFDPSYRLLLYHAALPLVLTPELLNYLRTEFLQGEVPWVAEVDLLLSDLCQPAGYELYTMDSAVRAYLLREMKQAPNLGQRRMEEVARRLIHYVRHLSKTNAFLDAQELQAQQWAAMVYIEEQQETAAHEIATAFKDAVPTTPTEMTTAQSAVNQTERTRLVKITQELAPGLEQFPDLLEYATSIAQLLAGPLKSEDEHYTQSTKLTKAPEFKKSELLSAKLSQRLVKVLSTCDAFESNRQLRAVFGDARLSPWRDNLPQTDELSSRVTQTIGYLQDKWNTGQENALCLLLRVLRDRTDQRDNRHRELTELIQRLACEGLPPPIPFINREDEIRVLLDSHVPYYLVDAPAGYGKTALLKRLKSHFEERGWLCAYAAVKEHSTLVEVVTSLADDLGATNFLNRALLPVQRLGIALVRCWGARVLNITGVILLIDFDKKPAPALFKEIVEKLIPVTQDNLKILNFFRDGVKFRVILTGRHLVGRKEVRTDKLRLQPVLLKPFDYVVIRESARQYLTNHADDTVSQIAAHLIYLTGGHPGCVARALEMYRDSGLSPDLFVEFYSQDICKNIVAPAINAIIKGFPESFPDFRSVVFERFGVLRYADHVILDYIAQDELSNIEGGYALEAKLLATYLFKRSGRLIHSDAIRRLLVIQLRQESPHKFQKLCHWAQSMCENRLYDPRVQAPEKWAVEYLFQALQQYAAHIQDKKQREVARSTFFGEHLPKSLHLLTQARNLPSQVLQEEINFLTYAMQSDWEFQFVVNYYLRDTRYTNIPYRQLKAQIDRFLA
jgi:hypothetical protein